jgi:hypothetical protein
MGITGKNKNNLCPVLVLLARTDSYLPGASEASQIFECSQTAVPTPLEAKRLRKCLVMTTTRIKNILLINDAKRETDQALLFSIHL